jgi:putative transposase
MKRPSLPFRPAIDGSDFPHKVVLDKSGANQAGLENINLLLMQAGLISFVEILQIKYLNNIVGGMIISGV